ncbi:MAG: DUF6142 family protein [Planctomycetota bacterium]
MTELKHSGKGISSTVIGNISILLFLLILSLSLMLYDAGRFTELTLWNIITGLVIFDFLLVMAGFIIGIKGICEPHRKKLFAILGTVLNSALLLVFLSVIIIGVIRYFSR